MTTGGGVGGTTGGGVMVASVGKGVMGGDVTTTGGGVPTGGSVMTGGAVSGGRVTPGVGARVLLVPRGPWASA